MHLTTVVLIYAKLEPTKIEKEITKMPDLCTAQLYQLPGASMTYLCTYKHTDTAKSTAAFRIPTNNRKSAS